MNVRTKRTDHPRQDHAEVPSLIVRLLPYIRDRKLESGERLPSERLLADRFNVTRAVVREGLAVLEAMRVVERRPRSGVYLRAESRVGSLDAAVMRTDLGMPLNQDEVTHLNEFRAILETQAVVLACARRTPADLAQMDECMRLCRERHERNESIAQPSADFHLAVMAATHNQFLLRAANSFYLATRIWREGVFADRKVGARSIRDHQGLRDAIARGDAAAASRLLRTHLEIADHYWYRSVAPPQHAARARKRIGAADTAARTKRSREDE